MKSNLEKKQDFTEDELNSEEWKPVAVDGFEHLYEVSTLGRVRRLADSCYRAARKAGAFLYPCARNSYGHIKVVLYNQNKKKIDMVASFGFIDVCWQSANRQARMRA